MSSSFDVAWVLVPIMMLLNFVVSVAAAYIGCRLALGGARGGLWSARGGA